MTMNARYADLLLREQGHGGLYNWAMDQRRRVQPPNYDVLASRLAEITDGEITTSGVSLRKWLVQFEAERDVIGHE